MSILRFVSDGTANKRRNATYYDGDLRRDLLDAAAAVIAVDGIGPVSLRALAKQLGVSHAAPANHFKDKRAIFTALAAEGFDRLGHAFIAAADGRDGTDRLRAGGLAYLAFARDQPGHFAVMFRADIADDDDDVLRAAGDATFAFLVDSVRSAQDAGWAATADATDLAVLLWSVVHGLAGLTAAGAIDSQFDLAAHELESRLVDQVIAAYAG